MLNPQDEEMLQRMLRVSSLQDDVRREAEIRTQLFHRSGFNGPLGAVALVDMLRFMGHSPAVEPTPTERIDWTKVDADGSVRVEARFGGAWCPGVFLGLIDNGVLTVRLDEDPYVKECRWDMVRFEQEAPPAPKNEWESVKVGDKLYMDVNGESVEVTYDGGSPDVGEVCVLIGSGKKAVRKSVKRESLTLAGAATSK